jgi:hypothetical protein
MQAITYSPEIESLKQTIRSFLFQRALVQMHIRSAQFKDHNVEMFESELETDFMCALKYFLGDVLSMTDTTFNNHRMLLINDEPFIVVYNTDKRRTLDRFLDESDHVDFNVNVLYGQVHSNRIVFSAINYDQNSKVSRNYFSMGIETPNLFDTDDAMQLRFKFIDNSLGNKRFVKKDQSFNTHRHSIPGSGKNTRVFPENESETVKNAKSPMLSIDQIDALTAQFGVACSVQPSEPEPVNKAKVPKLSVLQIDALVAQFGRSCNTDSSVLSVQAEKEKMSVLPDDNAEEPTVKVEVVCAVESGGPEIIEKANAVVVSNDQNNMSKLTKPELISLCKEKKIKNYSKLNKKELILLLSSK